MKPIKYLMFSVSSMRPWWYTDPTDNLPPVDYEEWSGMDEEEARDFARRGMFMCRAVADADRYWNEIHLLAHPEDNYEL